MNDINHVTYTLVEEPRRLDTDCEEVRGFMEDGKFVRVYKKMYIVDGPGIKLVDNSAYRQADLKVCFYEREGCEQMTKICEVGADCQTTIQAPEMKLPPCWTIMNHQKSECKRLPDSCP